MPNILLTRIDNRLIHGQVAAQWSGVLGANLLLVANDAVAKDEFRQGLMNMAAPAYGQFRRQSTLLEKQALLKRSSSFVKHLKMYYV